MPLKVNVGLTKKVGLPNYGSAGASCHVEFDLETGQILQDPAALQHNIECAYESCRQAVQQELSRQLNPAPPPRIGSAGTVDSPPPSAQEAVTGAEECVSHGAGNGACNGASNGDNHGEEDVAVTDAPLNSTTTTPATCGLLQVSALASQRQLNYIHHLAHGVSGLTPRRLEILSATICGKRLAHLTTADASQLIDTLKQVQAGDLDFRGAPREQEVLA